MTGNIRSALIAGAIAFVVYTVIALLTGSGFGAAVGFGLVLFVGTAVVTLIITLIFAAARKNRTAG